MKFLRFGPKGQEKPGCLDSDGKIRDLSAHTPDLQGSAVSLDALAKLSAIERDVAAARAEAEQYRQTIALINDMVQKEQELNRRLALVDHLVDV